MVSFFLSFTLGVWLLQQQAALPDMRWAWLLIALPFVLWLPRRIVRALLLTTLAATCGFFYAAWFAQQRLADELPAAWQGKNIEVVGVVAEMPRQHERGLSFTFDLESTEFSATFWPSCPPFSEPLPIVAEKAPMPTKPSLG